SKRRAQNCCRHVQHCWRTQMISGTNIYVAKPSHLPSLMSMLKSILTSWPNPIKAPVLLWCVLSVTRMTSPGGANCSYQLEQLLAVTDGLPERHLLGSRPSVGQRTIVLLPVRRSFQRKRL